MNQKVVEELTAYLDELNRITNAIKKRLALLFEDGDYDNKGYIIRKDPMCGMDDDYVLAYEDYKDPDTGKQFFTYQELVDLINNNKFPQGWRVPTARELEFALRTLKDMDDKQSRDILRKFLYSDSFSIAPRYMDEYNAAPSSFSMNRSGAPLYHIMPSAKTDDRKTTTVFGRGWSRSTEKERGCRIRLVKDI